MVVLIANVVAVVIAKVLVSSSLLPAPAAPIVVTILIQFFRLQYRRHLKGQIKEKKARLALFQKKTRREKFTRVS